MYGAFRPLFIQTTDIDVLCTIAEILKSEILDDQLSRQSMHHTHSLTRHHMVLILCYCSLSLFLVLR